MKKNVYLNSHNKFQPQSLCVRVLRFSEQIVCTQRCWNLKCFNMLQQHTTTCINVSVKHIQVIYHRNKSGFQACRSGGSPLGSVIKHCIWSPRRLLSTGFITCFDSWLDVSLMHSCCVLCPMIARRLIFICTKVTFSSERRGTHNIAARTRVLLCSLVWVLGVPRTHQLGSSDTTVKSKLSRHLLVIGVINSCEFRHFPCRGTGRSFGFCRRKRLVFTNSTHSELWANGFATKLV